MLVDYDSAFRPSDEIVRGWGRDWERYLRATVEGIARSCGPVERQLTAAFVREQFNPEIRFFFHIKFGTVSVELFINWPLQQCTLSLNKAEKHWMHFPFEAVTQEILLRASSDWEEIARTRGEAAACNLVSDIARDGFNDEVKRSIGLIGQFSRCLVANMDGRFSWFEAAKVL